jgi:methyl-accepting chemotaxis protein
MEDLSLARKQYLGDKVDYDFLIARFQEWKAIRSRSLDHINAGRKAEALKLNQTEGAAKLAEIRSQRVKVYEWSLRKAQDFRGKADAARDSALRLTLVLGVVGLASGMGVAVLIVRSLVRPIQQAVDIARAVANGDLGSPIHVQGSNETTQLLLALRDMQQGLVTVVTSVRQNSESVAAASAEIARGNLDLSERTEQQASALQQSSATAANLNTTVRNNADNSRHAEQLARGASSIAAQGGEVVSKVVSTMQGISASSRQIGDIIGVIDGIAFQTNILALNAAVEAARAGEQGRGFAVVAAEVRSLAQRSAEAAKQIKDLIGRSVAQVGQGSALVDQAGQTMGEIVKSIQQVSQIVAEITAASSEQSASVQQLGEVVGQLDQTTQQNAALVEQSAAAAASLKEQAQQLVQAVAVFRLAPHTAEGEH